MNRRHHQPTRNSSTQSLRGQRGGQFSTSSSRGNTYDLDNEYETSGQYQSENRANYSGASTSWGDDAYESGRAPTFRETDYDRFETNDRNRTPARFTSLDDDRYSSGRSFDRERGIDRDRSWDRSNRSMDRSRSSADRFGYPSNMDSWTHHAAPAEPEYVSYQYSTGVGRMAQQGWREEADRDLGRSASFGSYGEGSLDREYDSSIGLKGRSFFGKGPKGYKRSDDRIKEDVCETLARNPRVDASDIEVSVEAACVTLTGTVESKEIKRAAEMAIENLSGVDDVKNELRVKRADETTFASSSGGKSATSSISTKSRN